jgi:SAM-dependent methyltransferase
MSGGREGALEAVDRYYTGRLREFGAQARGADWNGEASQFLRFEQLCRILPADQAFTLCDLGCGYGALLDYLAPRYPRFTYYGVDVAQAMVDAARQRYASRGDVDFERGTVPSAAEYCVASGTFNVHAGTETGAWESHIEATLAAMNDSTSGGFAFNCLTSYSDPEWMRPHLYYGAPCRWFDFCKRSFSPHVTLLHDYGLYEFTILVRKRLGEH